MDHEGHEGSGAFWPFSCIVHDLISLSQLSNDPSLSSLPLLLVFLKSYSRPYLGIVPPTSSKQISATSEPGTLSGTASEEAAQANDAFPTLTTESEELVEKEIRDRFKKMCEGYFDNVSKKLVIEHNVSGTIAVAYIRTSAKGVGVLASARAGSAEP